MKILEWGNWLLFPGYKALTLGPFIVIRPGTSLNEVDVNHESIHWAQAKELAVIGFYILYVLNWIINIFRFETQKEAYRNIIFEKEAYKNETNLEYLKTREHYSYWKNK